MDRRRVKRWISVLLFGLIFLVSASQSGPIKNSSENPLAVNPKKGPVPSAAQPRTDAVKPGKAAPVIVPVTLPFPLVIENIYLQQGRIHVIVRNTGGRALAADAYATLRLTMEINGLKAFKEWTLLEMDPTRRLGQPRGRKDFDTGIVMAKKGPVSVTLGRGSWKVTQKTVVSPMTAKKNVMPSPPMTAQQKTQPLSIGKKPSKRPIPADDPGAGVAALDQVQTTAVIPGSPSAEPVPMLNDTGGIRITRPGTPQRFAPGDSMYVIFEMDHSLPEGDVNFHLYRLGSSDNALSVKRFPYRPLEGEWSGTFHWDLPVHGLPSGSDYYIHAVQAASGAWGTSDTVTIQPEGDGLIDISRPGAEEGATLGRDMEIRYRFAQGVAEGLVFFDLFAVNLSDGRQQGPLLTKTSHYRPAATGVPEPAHTLQWRLPDDLPRADRFFIVASHAAASGQSEPFSINPRPVLERQGELVGEHVYFGAAIEVTRPEAGQHFRLDEEFVYAWRMPDEDSAFDCGDLVRVDLVRQSDGSAKMIRGFTPSEGSDSDRWKISKEHNDPGMYHLKIFCDQGCVGRSAPFRVDGCDYGIESVQLTGGRMLEEGVDAAGTQAWISGNFKVRIEWNGELPPMAPSGDPFHDVAVIATRTGASLRRPGAKQDPFNYTQADASGIISVMLPFLISKDDIHRMLVGEFIPLEFRITAEGPGQDTDEGNNTFSGDLRILQYLENDLAMSVDISDLTVRRTPQIGPRDEYHFSQRFRVRNLSRNNVGGPPDPLSIRVGWSIQSNDPGQAAWVVYPGAEGEFTWDNVGADWSEGHIGHTLESSMPDGRRWRIELVADPHYRVIDPNRVNNRDAVTFSVEE